LLISFDFWYRLLHCFSTIFFCTVTAPVSCLSNCLHVALIVKKKREGLIHYISFTGTYIKNIFHVKIELFVTAKDPDPHSGEKLDPDSH
jgi:hypothetical protein